jgi:hypothetical protein
MVGRTEFSLSEIENSGDMGIFAINSVGGRPCSNAS